MKKRYSISLTIIILALLVFTLKDINLLEVLALLRKINLLFIALAIVSYVCMFLLWNVRFQYLLKDYVKSDFFFLLRTTMAGVFFNTITPGSNVGGELPRAYFLNAKYGKQKAKYMGHILADKTFNMLGSGIFLALSLFLVFPLLNISFGFKTILQSIVILIYLITIAVLISTYENKTLWISKKLIKIRSIRKIFKRDKALEIFLKRKIRSFANVYTTTLKNRKKVYISFLLSIVACLFNFLASYFIFLSLGYNLNILMIIIAVTIATALGDISPIPGGIGLIESIVILLYTAMAVPLAFGTTVALLSRVIYYIFALAIGGLAVLSLRWKRR